MGLAAIRKENGSIPYAPVDLIVVGLHLRWNGVWQRPNHLLTRLAAHVPVIVLEEPLVGDGPVVAHEVQPIGDRTTHAHAVSIVTPRRRAASDAVDGAALAAVRGLVGDRRPLVWLYTPMMLALADAFPGAPLVYDKMDELASFAHADPRIGQRERELLQRADVVFTGGRSLQRTVQHRTANAHCFPSGVDVAHFAAASTIAAHADIAPFGTGPVYGYIGVIDERLDLALIDALAQALPAATIVLVGPVVKIDPATLPRRPNIAYLGPRGYDDLPALLAGIDVALMPFAINEHTRNISPTKTLEYLAAGRPVVSTAIADVMSDHGDVVAIANTIEEFVAAVAAASGDSSQRVQRAQRAMRRAAESSWDAVAEGMREHCAQAGIAIGPAVAMHA